MTCNHENGPPRCPNCQGTLAECYEYGCDRVIAMREEQRAVVQKAIDRVEKATGKSRQRSNRFEVNPEGRHGAWIDDDEFSYDAAIRVTGDFETPEAKRAYMQAICDILNEQEDRIPWRNDGNTEPFFKFSVPSGGATQPDRESK